MLNGLAVKGTWCQACGSEFNPWNIHGRESEMMIINCS